MHTNLQQKATFEEETRKIREALLNISHTTYYNFFLQLIQNLSSQKKEKKEQRTTSA